MEMQININDIKNKISFMIVIELKISEIVSGLSLFIDINLIPVILNPNSVRIVKYPIKAAEKDKIPIFSNPNTLLR